MSNDLVVVKTKYRNISISGLPGAGSTTLGKHLAKHLDFKYYSGGDFMRKYAIEKGYCSDDAVRVDRIANRDDITIAEAKEHIFTREENNLEKWVKMYGKEWREWVVAPKTLPEEAPIYFWRSELYDLVIDTFKLGKEETLEKVIAAIAQN